MIFDYDCWSDGESCWCDVGGTSFFFSFLLSLE